MVMPPVLVAAATQPCASTHTAPTVSWGGGGGVGATAGKLGADAVEASLVALDEGEVAAAARNCTEMPSL